MRLMWVALVLSLAACDKVKPVTNEATGPVVTFTQTHSGTITSITGVDVDDNANTVTFNALANDPGGVKSITVTFSPFVNACTTVDGATYSGGADFPYGPAPGAQSASSSPDSDGDVPTELFTIQTVGPGPFTCNDYQDNNPPDLARPYGQTITATATATNYSGKTTTATLPITFALWP